MTSVEPASSRDFVEVQKLAERIQGIVAHPGHLYRILMDHFGGFFLVARDDGDIAGFEVGFPSKSRTDTYFLWQIGVSPEHRGRGVASSLVRATEQVAAEAGCSAVEATVDALNEPSCSLFESLGYSVESRGETIEVKGRRAMPDYYDSGTDQVLFRRELD